MFKLNIVTRIKSIETNLEVQEVLIPTELGPTCLLPKHTPMICNMNSGIIRIKSGNVEKKFFITQGICKILDQDISLLCDICQKPEEIDVQRAENAVAKYQPMIDQKTTKDEEYNQINEKLNRAKLRLELVKS